MCSASSGFLFCPCDRDSGLPLGSGQIYLPPGVSSWPIPLLLATEQQLLLFTQASEGIYQSPPIWCLMHFSGAFLLTGPRLGLSGLPGTSQSLRETSKKNFLVFVCGYFERYLYQNSLSPPARLGMQRQLDPCL